MSDECSCEACSPNDVFNMRMIVCAKCGNKRCPHATDHRNACTGSNEPGQKGSSWEHVKPHTHGRIKQEQKLENEANTGSKQVDSDRSSDI